MEKRERFKNIDFLRFVLTIAIVLFHIAIMGFPEFKQNCSLIKHFFIMTSNGHLAVDMFFIMAGFFMFYTYNPSVSVMDFLKKRVLRLYPLVLFFAVVYGAMWYFVYHLPGYRLYDEMMIALLLTNIFTLNKTGVTWFVSVLFWVSLLIFYCFRAFPRKYFNLLISTAVIFCYSFIIHANGGNIYGNTETYYNIFNVGIMRGIAGIGTGYLLYMFLQTIKTYKASNLKSFLYTVLECLFLYYVINNLAFHKLKYYSNFVIIIAFVGLLWLFILKRGYISKLLNNALFTGLGKYSYSIYIMHSFAIFTISKLFLLENKEFVILHPLFNIIAILLIAILLGVVTYHLVERPAARYLKNKWFPDKGKKPETLENTTIQPVGGGGN